MAWQDQIDDLKRQSKEYERQQTIRMKTRRTGGSEPEDQDLDINSIVVVGAARRPQHYASHRRPTYRDSR